MKNLLIALSLITAVSCTSAPEVVQEPIPAIEYEVGFSFDIPCDNPAHPVHVQVVSGSRLIRVYEISVEGEVTGDQIAEVLKMIEFMNSIQVVPVDPAAAEPATDVTEESR